MCMFCRLMLVIFLLAIVFSVLRFIHSDYPFGILNPFVHIYICKLKYFDFSWTWLASIKYNIPKVWFTLTSWAIASLFRPLGKEMLNCGLPLDVTAWFLKLFSLKCNALRYNLLKENKSETETENDEHPSIKKTGPILLLQIRGRGWLNELGRCI